MVNMWIKIAIAEGCGIPVVLSMKFHFLPIWLTIPMAVVASFAGIYGIRDSHNKFKENLKKFGFEEDVQ